MFKPKESPSYYNEKERFIINLYDDSCLNMLKVKADHQMSVDRVKNEDFNKYYGKEAVESDVAAAKLKKEEFAKKDNFDKAMAKKRADILEAIIYQQIEQSNYFGPNAWTIKTCDYDDFFNGVDLVLEIHSPEKNDFRHSGLAIDVTSSRDESIVGDKMRRILTNIKKGRLSEVKYFKSEQSGALRELKNIPSFVLGCDIRCMEKIVGPWYKDQEQKLTEHPIQILLLQEMVMQAEFFANYANKHGQSEIAKIYQEVLEDFKQIIAEKTDLLIKINQDDYNVNFVKNDKVLGAISKFIKNENEKLKNRKRFNY